MNSGGDPISTAVTVVLGLIFGPGLIILGIVLISRAGGARRRAQLQYADWALAQGYPVPPPFGSPPGTPPSAGGVPPSIPYPPEVTKTGSGNRVAGWIVLVVGIVVLLGRLGSVAG